MVLVTDQHSPGPSCGEEGVVGVWPRVRIRLPVVERDPPLSREIHDGGIEHRRAATVRPANLERHRLALGWGVEETVVACSCAGRLSERLQLRLCQAVTDWEEKRPTFERRIDLG